jgi:EmrB/QacA subfamily drug resistance transporter
LKQAAGSGRVLTALTTTMVLLVLDSSIVGVMLPSITADLELSTVSQAWVVSSYLLALAVFLPVGGKLADAYGPVSMFRAGMVGFVLASVGIAVADGAASIIVWRAIAGGAGALLMPATMSILVSTFPEETRARALSIYLGTGQAFAIVGPAIGGLCAQFIGWQWGFLLNVPVGLTGLLLVAMSRPGNRRTPVHSWDLLGMLTLTIGLTGLVLALLQAPDWGWTSAATIGCALAGISCLTVFSLRSLQAADPLLDLRLFSRPALSTSSAVLFCVGLITTAATIYGAVVMQESLGLSPAASGLALFPLVVPLLVTTRWAGRHYNALGPRQIGIAGALAAAAGLFIIAQGLAMMALWQVCAGLVLVGGAIGLLLTPMTTASMSAAPTDRRGQASGLISTCRQLGGIVGVGLFSVLIALQPKTDGRSGVVIGFTLCAGILLAAALLARKLPRVAAE